MRTSPLILALVASAGLLFSHSAQAASKIWNNIGTDFNAAANWTGGVPGANDVALFNVGPTVQPNLTASLTIAGLRLNDLTSGYDITSSGGAVLTLNGVNTTGSAGTTTASASAIRNDNVTGTTTIDAALNLAPSTLVSTIFQEAADGSVLILNGNIGQTGAVNLSMKNGTIQLNGTNSFATSSVDAAGTIVVVGNNSGLGAGTLTINNGAALQAGGGARTIANNIVVGADTTFSGGNAFTFNGTVTSAGSSSRILTVSNTGGAILNGAVNLEETGAPAGRIFTIGGTSNVIINGVVQNGDTQAAGLRYSGTGLLTLANTNTYTGGTLVGGNVTVTKDGGLGGGNVTLTAASITLTLQGGVTNNYIADTANVNIQIGTGTINLNFTGTDVINTLTIAGVNASPGIYGNGVGGTPLANLTGTGTFTVLTVIPEPATYMLMGLGILICAQTFCRKRS